MKKIIIIIIITVITFIVLNQQQENNMVNPQAVTVEMDLAKELESIDPKVLDSDFNE